MITIKCPQCEKYFKTHPYRLRESKRVFCSRKCMGDSYKIPGSHERKLLSLKKWRDNHKKEQAEYREKNKDKMKEFLREYYFKNKNNPHYKSIQKSCYVNRKKRWREDSEANLKENISVSKFRSEKMKKDLKWKNRMIEDSNQRREERQEKSIENGAVFKGYLWTEGEIEYLMKNYKKKTRLEMAIELNRTYKSVQAALWRHKIGRKNRVLKSIYY